MPDNFWTKIGNPCLSARQTADMSLIKSTDSPDWINNSDFAVVSFFLAKRTRLKCLFKKLLIDLELTAITRSRNLLSNKKYMGNAYFQAHFGSNLHAYSVASQIGHSLLQTFLGMETLFLVCQIFKNLKVSSKQFSISVIIVWGQPFRNYHIWPRSISLKKYEDDKKLVFDNLT